MTITRPDPNAKPITLSLTIADGRWSSPQLEMGAGFAGVLVMTSVQRFRPYQLVEWKAKYLKDMDRFGKILDNLQAARDVQRFPGRDGRPAFAVRAPKAAQLSAKQPPLTQTQTMSFERQANTTMVVVKGLHSIEEPTFAELAKSLRTLSASTLRGPMDIEGSTLFFVGPADSMFEQTVKAIQVGKIAQDKLRDTVTVELPTSLKEESSTADAGAKAK